MLEYTVGDFIEDVRTRIGDTSRSVPASSIMGYLRTALRRVARTDGTEKLFEARDVIDLANINKDGTPSASWELSKLGTIIDIPHLRILGTTPSRIKPLCPGYMDVREFYQNYPVPEQNSPGEPTAFTIDSVGTNSNRLIFNKPIKELVTIDIWYSVFPARISSPSDKFPISYDFADLLEEYVIILHNIEATDDNRARALWEDVDVLTAEIVEMLARRKKGLPYRRIRRSL